MENGKLILDAAVAVECFGLTNIILLPYSLIRDQR